MSGAISGEQFGEHVRKHGLNAHPWMDSGGPEERPRPHTDEEWAANDVTMEKIHEREGQAGTEAAYAAKGSTAKAQDERLHMDTVADEAASEFYKKPLDRWYSQANAVDVEGQKRIAESLNVGDQAGAWKAARFHHIVQQKLGHEAIMAPSIAGTVPSQRTW